MKFLVLILILCSSISYINSFSFWAPKWSDNYHVKGLLSIPDVGVVEPFEVWYSKSLRKSRVDFYNGMVQTFQSYDYEFYGADYKIFPYTDERNTNIEACLKLPGSYAHRIHLQAALYPLDEIFKYEGKVQFNGELVQKWILDVKKTINLNATFYMKCTNENAFFSRPKCKPIRLEMQGGNIIFPSHVGNYFIDYELYEPDIVTKEMVQIEFPVCHDIRDVTAVNRRSFNPLSEFFPSISELLNEDRGFDNFTKKHGFRFQNYKEYINRLSNFKKKFNGNSKSKSKTNKLADLSAPDFTAYNKRIRNNYSPFLKNKRKLLKTTVSVRMFEYSEYDLKLLSNYTYYNLHEMGAMNPIQSQLNCGSCWAFATAAALEGNYYMKHKKLVKLSEQALVDCSWGYKNLGCDGGMELYALDWIMKHKGLPLSKQYGTYKANNGYCAKQNRSETVLVKGYGVIQYGDYRAIQIALLKHGPVLTAMHASLRSLGLYSGGIYNDINCESSAFALDHAVVIVGFGYKNDKLYWIVRNSWSPKWGLKGHLLIAAENNICGLATRPIVIYTN